MNKKHAVVFFLFLFISFSVSFMHSQEKEQKKNNESTELLPLDPSVLTGKFENGLTYYIRENKKPEKRAELRLAVKAGSILEDNDQQGLAHFCEHMAFNGTKNFPKQDIINYLESIGMKFGPEVNAGTGFDNTVYMIQVPTDKEELMLKGIQILEEWAHNISYDPVEIDKERGVILEEERLGRGAEERMQNIQLPIILKGSRYAERLPIGKREIIEKFEHKSLIRFYKEWYRPDLMAVIAVGDFDKTKIFEIIKNHFAAIPAVKEPREVNSYPVPNHKETLYTIASDKEASAATVSIMCKHETSLIKTINDYRKSLIERLANGMLSQRISELTQKPDATFTMGGAYKSGIVLTKDFFFLNANYVKDNLLEKTFEILLTEMERVKKYGFTESELERQKAGTLRGVEKLYNEKDKTESVRYAGEYVALFTRKSPSMGIDYVYEASKKILPTIKLSEVNTAAKNMLTSENTVVSVNSPEKKDIKIPTEKQFAEIFESISKKEITAYDDKTMNQPLLEKEPSPAKMVSENKISDLNITEWILANGVKVVLKPTDFKNDEILFSASSPGGTSLVRDKDYISLAYSGGILRQCGIGKYDAIALRKYLTGKIASVNPFIGELQEGMQGNCSPKDIETMFQMIYLYFTNPNKNKDGFLAFKAQIEGYLQNLKASPDMAFNDTIGVTLGQYNFRRRPLSKELLNELDFETVFEKYKERFADASDFTFFFVGNFECEKIKPFIEKYIGGLPSIKRTENWRDLKIYPPTGIINKNVYKGIEDKSAVLIHYNSPLEWTTQNRFDLEALSKLLEIKLRENIREEKGGTYGIGTNGSSNHFPRDWSEFTIYFGCKPSRVDELVKTVFDVIDSVKNFETTETYLTKIKEGQRRSRETNLKQNNWWLNKLSSTYYYNENPLIILDYNKYIDNLKASNIKDAAIKMFNQNRVKVVLYPEKK